MDKAELLAELDTYYVVRTSDSFVRALGNINVFQVIGAIVRADDRAEEHSLLFYVYDEGGPGEVAYYSGDPINALWQRKVEDYITVTNEWAGRIFWSRKPKAVCLLIEDPAVGEKWAMITETAPDVYSKEDIAGAITIDL